MSSFSLSIITPETTLFSADATMAVIPGVLGDFGVLIGHMPFISVIRPGIIVVDSPAGKRRIGVLGGIAEVVPERCTILAEVATDFTEFTAADIQAHIQLAREALAVAESEKEKHEAQKKMSLAEALGLPV